MQNSLKKLLNQVKFSLEQAIFLKTLKMVQTSGPETLVIHQKSTPGNNPEDFKQH
jgi:hypothetical protein